MNNRRYLLDTHIFLWWLNNDKRLKHATRAILENQNNQICVSVITAWEMAIKHKNKKIALKTTIKYSFAISGFTVLPVTLDHVLQLEKLPLHHKDPFDRMLIAQAKTEKLILVTDDVKIKKYDVKVE